MSRINIEITSEDDLFNKFDADRHTLSDSFMSFMQRQYDESRDGGVPVIRFISAAPLDEARIRQALERFARMELAKNKLQRRRNRLTELYLFVLGVACIVAGILLTKLGAIYLQILSLTAGFAIKEAATIFFIKNPKNTLDRARLLFLSRSKLEFAAKEA